MKYITTKSATAWKNNSKATGDFNQSLSVRILPAGTVIDVISEGETRTSYTITPTLNIGNGEWINKSDAKLYSGNEVIASIKASTKPSHIFIFIAIVAVLYFILKPKK